jgi:hypothetical protein
LEIGSSTIQFSFDANGNQSAAKVFLLDSYLTVNKHSNQSSFQIF